MLGLFPSCRHRGVLSAVASLALVLPVAMGAVPDLLLVPDSGAGPIRVCAFDPVTGDLVDPDFIPDSSDPDPTGYTFYCHASLSNRNTVLVTDVFDIGSYMAQVHEFDLQGVYLGVFSDENQFPGPSPYVRSLRRLPNGRLGLISSALTFANIFELDPDDGSYLGDFFVLGDAELVTPRDYLVRETDILVTDQITEFDPSRPDAIHQFDLQGNYLDTFAEYGLAEVGATNISLAANGNVLVATWIMGPCEFTAEGILIRFFPGVQCRGVHELGNGNLLVCYDAYPVLFQKWVGEYDRATGQLIAKKLDGARGQYIQRIHGPALVAVESLADHGPAGVIGVNVDLTAEAGAPIVPPLQGGTTGGYVGWAPPTISPGSMGGMVKPAEAGRRHAGTQTHARAALGHATQSLPDWHPSRFPPMTMPGSLRTDPIPATLDPGLVTTEPRASGIAQLRLTFEFALTDDAAGLDELALSIASDPPGAAIPTFTTALNDDAKTLTVTFASPLPDQYLYTIEVTRDVTTHPGDRRFQIRNLRGNVANDLGAPLQTVNAIDLGISQGVRGQFLSPGQLVTASNAKFDVNLDGTINAGDYSYIRLTGGVFGNTAP